MPPFFCKKIKSFKTIKSISNGSEATAKCPRTNIGFCSLFNEAEAKTFDNKCKGRKFDLSYINRRVFRMSRSSYVFGKTFKQTQNK